MILKISTECPPYLTGRGEVIRQTLVVRSDSSVFI